MQIYPSLLPFFDKYGNPEPVILIEAALAAQNAGADGLHLDFMAPPFLERTTFSIDIIQQLREAGVTMPLDVHMMTGMDVVYHLPLKYINSLTFHPKMATYFDEIIKNLAYLQECGVEGGLAIDTDEAVAPLTEILSHPACRRVLLMTVQAGAGGQPFRADMLSKIKEIHDINPKITVMVDGGVSAKTAPLAALAGAKAAVAGSAVYNDQDIEMNINTLKSAL